MIKICMWMNIPSHYQTTFFNALNARSDVDLRVVYLQGVSRERAAEGWCGEYECQAYECFAVASGLPRDLGTMLPDWEERIHIISGSFSSILIDHFCRIGVQWCHWSEMPGIRLAELLRYRMALFRLLNPIMLFCKRREGRIIRDHALGAFGQGRLARKAFHLMGVPDTRIADLYYTSEALERADPCENVVRFSGGRNVFLSVGALCHRKGIDVLLKAFARLKTNDWCLVLCGLDRTAGIYRALARKLGIENSVLFLGAYPAERIAEVYAAADVFVLPSRFDGWGVVLNEAASLGIPIIGSDLCGASWHVIEEGRNGFRVRTASVPAFTKAFRAFVEEPERISEYGVAAKKRYFNAFTPEHNAERLVTALRAWSCQ